MPLIATTVCALLLLAAQDIMIAPPAGNSLVPPPREAPEPPVEPGWQARVVAQIVRGQHYPPAALDAAVQGTAHVRFRVDAGGRVTAARIVHSSGNALLDAEAVQSVLRARPLPAMPDGMAGPVELVLPVTFRIAD